MINFFVVNVVLKETIFINMYDMINVCDEKIFRELFIEIYIFKDNL